MDWEQVVRAFEGLTEAFSFGDDSQYPLGAKALAAADVLARLEHRDAVLKRWGEKIGEVDHYSEATAVASAGAHAARALLEIVSAGFGDARACLVLEHVEPAPALDRSGDAETAYVFVEDVVENVLEDVTLSWGAARSRAARLGSLERRGSAVDQRGRVTGDPAKALAVPRAQEWCLEFAADAAHVVEDSTDEPEDEDDSEVADCLRRGAFTNAQIRQAVAALVIGQGYLPVANAYGAYQSAAFAWLETIAADSSGLEGRADGVEALMEAGTQLLRAARAHAACCTAFAALEDCLGPLGAEGNPSRGD